MKQRKTTSHLGTGNSIIQILGVDQLIDFEGWLGYEFWSLQVGTEIDCDFHSLKPEASISEKGVMEAQSPYGIRQNLEEQIESRNDALPF